MKRNNQTPEHRFQPPPPPPQHRQQQQQHYPNYNWPPPPPPQFYQNLRRQHLLQFHPPKMLQHQQQQQRFQQQHHRPAIRQVQPSVPLAMANEAENSEITKLHKELADQKKLITQLIAEKRAVQAEKEKLQNDCDNLMDGHKKLLEEIEQLEETLESRVPKKEFADASTETEAEAIHVDMVCEADDEYYVMDGETIKQRANLNAYMAQLTAEKVAEQKKVADREATIASLTAEKEKFRHKLDSLHKENERMKKDFVDIRRLQKSWDEMRRERDVMLKELKDAKKTIKILEANGSMEMNVQNTSRSNK